MYLIYKNFYLQVLEYKYSIYMINADYWITYIG